MIIVANRCHARVRSAAGIVTTTVPSASRWSPALFVNSPVRPAVAALSAKHPAEKKPTKFWHNSPREAPSDHWLLRSAASIWSARVVVS